MTTREVDVVSRLRRETHKGLAAQAWDRCCAALSAGAPSRRLQAARRSADALLGKISVLCPRCSHPVERETLAEGERVFWCAHCSAVREVPVFRIPGWVAGTLVVLAIKLHFAL
jgi:hypothetical protein